MKNITIVLGTARKGRVSERVFKALDSACIEFGIKHTLVDVADHVTLPETIPAWAEYGSDNVPTKWKEIVLNTDIFLFILPEYNHGYPGEWKLLIDSLSSEYKDKTAHIVGVSSGIFAGVRVADHVRPVLTELGFISKKDSLYVGTAKEVISEDGSILNEALAGRIKKFLKNVQL